MTSRASRNARAQQVTTALSVVLAASLGVIVYFAVTSLPYLATSPSTDATFGALNACVLNALPERVGFAVSRDGTKVAAFSPARLVECAGEPPAASVHELPGVTLAAYDGAGMLWAATRQQLLRLQGNTFVEQGALALSSLVGAAYGVVALGEDGQLVSVKADGTVQTRALPDARGVRLAANADGALVALWGGGRFSVVNSVTLESTRAEVACPVREVWWRPEPALLVAACDELAFEVHALTSEQVLLPARSRAAATLLGPGGSYVTPCDVLPCTAEPPR